MTPALAYDRDHLADFSNAVASYLNVMAATGDCLEQTYPEVGNLYRQRIHRLRTRVAFQATREAIKESASTLEVELKDFAQVTNRVLTQRSVELTRGILALGDLIEKLAKRQEYFGNRLLYLSSQVDNLAAPAALPAGDPSEGATQAAGIRGLVESMGLEASSMLAQMRERMNDLEQRLAGTASTDTITGLINRREMERQMEAHKLHGSKFSLLIFRLSGPLSDQVMRLAAAKISTQFRHPEWIARWEEREFAVLFLGAPELAEARAVQAIAALEGDYTLHNGETVVIAAQARLLEPEFAMA
jgi:GGDEF domain-containing protein